MVLADIAMSIHERKTKTKGTTWVVRWRDPSGAPKEKTFKLKRDAVNFEARMLTELANGTYRDPRNDRTTVTEWHHQWWPTIEGNDLAPGTVAIYESLLRIHILPDLGKRPMSTVRRIDVEQWLTTKRKQGLSGSTLSKMKSLLGRLFSSAVDNNVVTNNPVLGIRSTGLKPAKPKPVLTQTEVEALITVLPSEYRALARTLAYAGLRPSEALFLRRRHLDGNTLTIEGGLVESQGTLTERPPKTGKARRVQLGPTALAALEQHLAHRPGEPDARIFVTESGTDIWLSNFRRTLRSVVLELGLDPAVTPYALRHTCATWLAQEAVPVPVAAKMLGHHPNVYLNTYVHVSDHDLPIAAAALERGFANRPVPHLHAV